MLEALDLEPVQQQTYEALVDGALTVPEIRASLGLPATRVRAVLASLERLGLVECTAGARSAPDRYLPVAPEVAFEALLTAREGELQRARRHVQLLAARFRASGDARDAADLVEIVTGRAAVIQGVDQLQRSARRQIRGIDRPPYANTGPDRQDPKTGMMPLQAQTMRRGVGYRVIYDTDGLAGYHRLDTDIEACAELGEEARVMAGTPTKMMIADDRLGLIPLRAAPHEMVSSVLVHPSGLLEALCEFFEVLWAGALPLSDYLADRPTGAADGPSGDDARLLALLTTGLTDQVMARQLGISHRTFQRRLRDLMSRLGATTRFQLGLRAARQGWIIAGEDGGAGGLAGHGAVGSRPVA